jgi:hypothetical protein
MRECVVCLEELSDFVALPCEHELCVSCYPKVVKSTSRCPLCDRQIEATFFVDVDIDTPTLTEDPECNCFFRSMCVVFGLLLGYSIYFSAHR